MSCCGRSSGRSRGGTSRLRKPKQLKANQVKAQMAKMGPPIAKFLLVRPQFYGINYSINPWMDTKNNADRPKAMHQWNQLTGTLRRLGAHIRHVGPRRNLPDMVFTANAGFFIKNTETLVLSNFKYSERKGEEEWFERFFENEGYHVRKINGTFEGAGDCLYLGDRLIGGYGFRTDQSVYESLVAGIVEVQLVDPYYYHLDTCFCPLRQMDYLIWPGAFSSDALNKIRSLGGTEIEVPEDEARHFACNAVVVGNNVILPFDCPTTEDRLKQAGYKTYPLPMTEFIKSGGACKCLTLRLP